VKKLADEKGVFVTGRVEDVRPYMLEAAVYVVPLRIGGGTRLKIFEAMAMGKAVVSTAIGAEGLPLVNGEHFVLADGARGLAQAVVGLLRDRKRRQALGTSARALVVGRYDWSAVVGNLEKALLRFARAGSTRAAVLQESMVVGK
jgi:glycosyltransferase involved in cell wall biosynthesis